MEFYYTSMFKCYKCPIMYADATNKHSSNVRLGIVVSN